MRPAFDSPRTQLAPPLAAPRTCSASPTAASRARLASPTTTAVVFAVAALSALAPAAFADPAPAAAPAAAKPAPIAPPTIAPTPPAPIEPVRFELLDRGDAVEVIAHNVKAARTAISPVRQRLEVPIVGAPQAKRVTPGDATVKLIELDREESTHVLSVKLGFERADVKALSRFAQAIQVGDDLHLLVPRKLPEADTAPRLPEPTLPPALAKIDVPATPVVGPRPEPPAPPPAARPDAARRDAPGPVAAVPAVPGKPRSAAEALAAGGLAAPTAPARAAATRDATAPTAANAATAPSGANSPSAPNAPTAHSPSAPAAAGTHDTAPATDARDATTPASGKSLHQALAGDRDDDWSKISLYAALGLGAAGAGAWVMRRRRGAHPDAAASIDIIAQRSIGGKARLVWFSAGQREMIVAVTAQQVRMLGQWRRTERASERPYERLSERLGERLTDGPTDGPTERASARTKERSMTGRLPFASGSSPGIGSGLPAAYPDDGRRETTNSMPSMQAIPGMPGIPYEKPVSPAVSGLLRLRNRTGQMPAITDPEGEADPAADELWAKEILAATNRGARR